VVKRLKIYVDWDACFMGNDKLRPQPSVYNPQVNEIWVNPYFIFDSWKAFLFPLIHEVSHWIVWRLISSWAGRMQEIHDKLDQMYWFIVKAKWKRKLYNKRGLSYR